MSVIMLSVRFGLCWCCKCLWIVKFWLLRNVDWWMKLLCLSCLVSVLVFLRSGLDRLNIRCWRNCVRFWYKWLVIWIRLVWFWLFDLDCVCFDRMLWVICEFDILFLYEVEMSCCWVGFIYLNIFCVILCWWDVCFWKGIVNEFWYVYRVCVKCVVSGLDCCIG